MNAPHLRTLDLNLLRVFVALLDEGNVTRAGVRLGLTQSAVSHALNRLRYTLGDELFIRGPSGMQPTPRAGEIAPRIRAGLAQLQAALAPAEFDPAETDRCFVIAAGAYVASVLMPAVAARLEAEAPQASIRLRNLEGPIAEELDTGRCDLAITMFGRTPTRFASERVFDDTIVWVMRRDHPCANQPLTLDLLAALPQLAVVSGDVPDHVPGLVVELGLARRVVLDDGASEHLAARGLQRQVRLTVADTHSAMAVAARSDMITATPRGLYHLFGQPLGLKAVEPPYPAPPRDIRALWLRDNDGPALQWLRGLVREAGARFMEGRDGEGRDGV
jgi:DNA-binding transcriptional LysR family regulator